MQLAVLWKDGVATLAEAEDGVPLVPSLPDGGLLAQSVINTLIGGVVPLLLRLGHVRQETSGRNGEALKASPLVPTVTVVRQLLALCSWLKLHGGMFAWDVLCLWPIVSVFCYPNVGVFYKHLACFCRGSKGAAHAS